MKKLLAVAVALVLAMALSVSVFAEDVVWKLAPVDKLGQYMDTLSVGDSGVELSLEDGGTPRIATNWVNGGVFNSIVDGVKTEGATLKIYTSTPIKSVAFQSESGGYERTEAACFEVDGKILTVVDCATLAAAAPVATSGSFGGWCNFMIEGVEEGIVLYGVEIVTGYEQPAGAVAVSAEEPAAEEPAADAPADAPAAETAEAPETGLGLALVPAVMALAAVAVSKKH